MRRIAVSLCIAGAIALPSFAEARPVTLTAQLQNYSGNAAFLAFYVTDTNGKYQKTLWVSGKKTKYYRNLRDWARGSRLNASEFDAVTGASVGSGTTLKVTVELADALIDSGYEIRVDSAVEDKPDKPADVRAPLTTAGAGKPVTGNGYIKSFTYTF
jgi:hypothetical protein